MWDYPFGLLRRLLLAFVALLTCCFAAAWSLAQAGDALQTLTNLIPVALAILVSMYIAEVVGVTEQPAPRPRAESIFTAIGVACVSMACGYVVLPHYAPPAELVCAAPALSAVGVYLQRRWVEVHRPKERVSAAIFASTRADADRTLELLREIDCVSVRAVVLPPAVDDRAPVEGIPVALPSRNLRELKACGIGMVIVGRATPEDARTILTPCAGTGFLVEPVGDVVARNRGCVDLRGANDLALLARLTSQARPYAAQRVVDLLVASALLLVALPIGVLIALAVKLSSRGPVFYRQTRVGLWGRTFEILKFRTMHADAEHRTGPVWALEADPRVTPVGRFLRACRLDELPQLGNVLRGDMSLVGPRPERPYFVERLALAIPLYDARHSVRPGVTGWAQIRYPYGSSEDDSREKLGYDLFYILNRSLVFYFAVLIETAKVLLFRRGGR